MSLEERLSVRRGGSRSTQGSRSQRRAVLFWEAEELRVGEWLGYTGFQGLPTSQHSSVFERASM